MSGETRIHFEFHSIRFAVDTDTNERLALTDGTLEDDRQTKGRFGLAIAPTADGEWALRKVTSSSCVAAHLQIAHVLRDLVNRTARLLKTINVWPEQTNDRNGARLCINEQLAPSEVADRVAISFRPGMLSLPMASWDSMWALIEQRISGDPFFQVRGFGLEEIERVIEPLKPIFPGEWVKARYRRAIDEGVQATMAATLPPEHPDWFPAYHLARTALGAVCIDPGWNYLVEIGFSLHELQGVDGLHALTRQLARSPGSQHHLCLAAELFRRGHLIALEPKTGSGKNDLLAKCGDRQYDIEVKEFASDNPGKQLARAIEKKSNQLPQHPERPVVLHAVLIEKGVFDKDKEEQFFKEVKALVGTLPPKISAVVAGRRFVDSSGGRVKRDSEVQILNQEALVAANDDDLRVLFARNYDTLCYPLFGIGSFFYFDTGAEFDDSS